MRRHILLTLLTLALATGALAQVDTFWLFQGVVPMVYEVHGRVPTNLYTEEGTVLDSEQISSSLELRVGDPAVLIRNGAIVGQGRVSEVVAALHPESRSGRVLYVRLEGLPEGVTFPRTPAGHAPLAAGEYDLLVITDKPVDVLAVDPLFENIVWGQQDYVVRVGQQRFAVIRENAPRAEGFRGWQVSSIAGTKSTRRTADYTWWRQ